MLDYRVRPGFTGRTRTKILSVHPNPLGCAFGYLIGWPPGYPGGYPRGYPWDNRSVCWIGNQIDCRLFC